MIDILFKGKRTDNGEWVVGQLYKRSLYYGDPSVKYYIIVSTEDLSYDQALDYYEVIPETVGQFTGYTDGKDKRIFKGDMYEAIIRSGLKRLEHDDNWMASAKALQQIPY